ncbi:non-ribosomal peptide synthetase [Pseudomonas sp. SDI]|uniref:non-ribosomal peptide synthetase n=1 Tax=Pseudomonas sp. SDI TaxID=2170734 RepID=UPI000DE5F557|nr:non-ribosomal peptide synthetase [Pseudomonas sp. SDI]PWB30940.1 non-ribosomal peptide synthetase [Pseudomonas sp. SDI]
MAGMDNVALVQRFIKLPLEQRKAFFDKLASKGMSLAQLPIPVSCAGLARFETSYAQQRQWFLWQLEPDSPAYHIPAALRLRGVLDIDALQRSFDALLARHQTLRTTFEEDGGQLLQVVAPQVELHIEHEQWAAMADRQQREARLTAFIDEQTRRLFDLQQSPLMRVTLLSLGNDEHVLVMVLHHIVSDGWSMGVMVDELLQLYAGFSRQQPAPLPPLPIQYGDYSVWQRRWMEAGERERQLAYWTAQLGGEQVLLELPTDFPRPAQQSYRGARLDLDLPAALGQALKRLAQRENCTPFMVLLASFQALLHRYSGQRDIRIGVPIANRHRAETAGLIGFFINTQVLKAEVDPRQPFAELLRQARDTTAAAQAHQDLPFEQLVEALQPARNLSHGALFQVMHNHRSEAPRAVPSNDLGLQIDNLVLPSHSSKFDLTLETLEHPQGFSASLIYAYDLFSAATIERLAGHWLNLLQAVLDNPQLAVGDCDLRSADEQAQTLGEVHTAGELPSVVERFEANAALYPQRLAVVAGIQALSYAELERRANALAARLVAQGIGSDCRVGIAAERSVHWLVAVLAVLKTGAAYLALDIASPAERQCQLLEDSGVAALLSDGSLPAGLNPALAVLAIEAAGEQGGVALPSRARLSGEPAYIVYTSGSTGRPKGVVVSHAALANYVDGVLARIPLAEASNLAMVSTVAADLGYTLLFGALCAGQTLHLIDAERMMDADGFARYMDEQQIDALKIVPSHLAALLKVEQAQRVLPRQCLILGGEACSAGLLDEIERLSPHTAVFNHYGPSETTVGVLAGAMQMSERGTALLGQPLANSRVQVLDDELHAVARGVAGELYIGGAGLAQGYLDQPGLTAERFVPDPFAADGSRLYRSGDRVRLGNRGLEYRGRVDDQLKIRGFRVEPGEVAAALRQLPGVAEALVLARDTGVGRQLVAYVLATEPSADPAVQAQLRDTLLAALKAELPDYLLPAHLLVLEQLPLNANGKLDRKRLPEPAQLAGAGAWQAPQGEMESRIAAIWQGVLKVERVGRNDNFFELGGDSIISIQVVSRARQAGIRFSPKALFQHQTVQALACIAQIETRGSDAQVEVSGSARLLPIQQAFFAAAMPQQDHWNQSVLLTPAAPLQASRVEQAVQALVRQHDALRLRFSHDGEQHWRADFIEWPTLQAAWAKAPLLWQAEVADADALLALGEQAQRSLDIEQGQLLRAVLATLANGEQRLLLVIHHLVVDGVSWRILFEDLQQAYQQLQAGRAVELPAKTSSVQQWAEQLHAYAASPALAAEVAFWCNQLDGARAELPCRNPDGARQNRHARSVQLQLDAEQTRQLLQQAPAAYRTQVNDLLLTALARAVAPWSGQAGALVQLEGHGREDLFEQLDLTRTLGWFTSKYPVWLQPAAERGASLKAVKEQLRAAPNKGLGFAVLRYLGDADARATLAALPSPRITFNYLGQFDSSFAGEQAALFAPAREAAGAEQSPDAPMGNWLTLTGQVYDGRLRLSWTFSSEVFDEAAIQALAEAYLNELQCLIEHCLSSAAAGVTPSDFPLAPLNQAQLDSLDLPLGNLDDLYPLSPMQQGMLFHSLYAETAGDYINQMRLDIDGLDPQRFRAAWARCVEAHAILRSGFVWQGALEQPLQVVFKQVELPFEVHDLRGVGDVRQALDALAAAQLAQGFVLGQAPLLRLLLGRTSEQGYHLIYTHHHILMDGWSSSRLLGEVLQHYRGAGPVGSVGRYRDYIAWLQRQDAAADQAFWQRQLANLDEPTRLADALVRPPAGAVGYGNHYQVLDAGKTRQLGEFARQQKVTLNTLVQAAWLLILQRYSGKPDVCFGATVAGRPAELPGVEQQIGLFINTLPVIARPEARQPLGDWLQQVQACNLALREHEHTPLFDIQRWAGQGGAPLFDTILIFENYPVSEALAQQAPKDLRFGEIANHEQTNYPLALAVGLGETLSLHFSFAHAQFGVAAIERLGAQLEQLLCGMPANPARPLGELQLLGQAEREQVLHAWNSTAVAHDLHLNIAQRFERQVDQAPHHPALEFAGQTLSYAELDRRANSLAHALIERGVGPDVLVGIAVERSLEMIVGLLAVLKAGGAYIPLDPAYPEERLAYMIEDSGINLLLTQAHLLASLPLPPQVQALLLDHADTAFADYPASRPSSAVQADNLAYVIYTSGSTGKPKGVMIAHAALVNFVASMAACPGLARGERMLSLTTFSFDIFGLEIYLPLLVGATVILTEKATSMDPSAALALIEQARVSALQATPSTWRMLLDHERAEVLRGRRLLCGGEALPDALAQRMLALEAQVWNLYGPTETTIWSAVQPLSRMAPQPWLGRPIDNTQLHLLDTELEPNPIGVAGELLIGGAGLARGYLHRPALTAERFVPNPFASNGERLYRSGDLARYREDGVVEYIGRIDHQVKIRGFRIELGEIEARLLAHPQLREAAVLAQDGPGGQQLVAYLVPADSQWLSAPTAQQLEQRDQLRAWLRETLPEFMLPAHLLLLERFPLTPNGKLDRKALPSIDQAHLRKAYRAPQSELEQQLAAIWCAVLEVEQVGLDDNFFDLGGHSLLATQVMVRVRNQLRTEIALKALFDSADLAGFVQRVQALRQGGSALDEELAKSLEALKRLSSVELEKLISE